MSTMTRIIKPDNVAFRRDERRQFALDLLLGLSESPKRIPSKYIYDTEGSRLFQEITQLPEYYITQCELEIFRTRAEEIVSQVGGPFLQLVELGAGDGHKTSVLIDRFLEKGVNLRYVPIDISEAALEGLCDAFSEQYPDLEVLGIASDYFEGLKWLTDQNRQKSLVLFLGSSIGNFSRSQTRVFLRSLWSSLHPDDYVLIGFDLKKDIDVLLKAYNDSSGITSRFNRNLLVRVNRELGGNFDLTKFRHFSTYDVFSGAMESYLVSLEAQVVYIKEMSQAFRFKPWEPIHTEYSYKYLESDISKVAVETGFVIEKQLFDSKHYFVDSIWRVHKPLDLQE